MSTLGLDTICPSLGFRSPLASGPPFSFISDFDVVKSKVDSVNEYTTTRHSMPHQKHSIHSPLSVCSPF